MKNGLRLKLNFSVPHDVAQNHRQMPENWQRIPGKKMRLVVH